MRITKRQEDDKELKELHERLIEAKKHKSEAEQEIEETQAMIVKIAESQGKKSLTVASGDQKYKLTVVISERMTYDEPSLRKALGAKSWKKIITEKVDSNKLKEAITDGTVDVQTVAEHSKVVEGKPYIRISTQNT